MQLIIRWKKLIINQNQGSLTLYFFSIPEMSHKHKHNVYRQRVQEKLELIAKEEKHIFDVIHNISAEVCLLV